MKKVLQTVYLITASCSALLFTSYFPSPVNAQSAVQSIPSELLKKLPDTVVKQLSAISAQDFARGTFTPPTVKYDRPLKPSDWESSLPITLHLRGGSGLPLQASLPKNAPQQTSSTQARASEARKQFQEITQLAKTRYRSLPRLPSCFKDKSNLKESDPDESSTPLMDLLFIEKEMIPVDVAEIFGKDTRIIAYDVENPRGEAFNALSFNITCLPSRVIISGRGSRRLEGLPALKNYDANPSGDGFIHDSMKPNLRRLFSKPE